MDTHSYTDEEQLDALLAGSPVFGRLDAETRATLRKELELRAVERGTRLIAQGEPADGLFFVGSGRLQVTLTQADGEQAVVGEVGRGEVTGEMALLTDKPRSATVTALRDSHVYFLSSDAFARIIREHPDALRVVSSAVIDKLVMTIRHGVSTTPAVSIAVVPLDPAGGVEFATMLGESLRRLLGAVALVRSRDLTESLGVNPSRLARAMWRERLESASSAVVYLASSEFDTWTEECVHQCDVIVWVADAGASPEIRAIEREVRRREASVPRRSELVLLHDASTSLPRGTRRWLAPRQVDRHHHVRVDRTTDVDRVARLLTGRGIGVVFGGGGARGVAHIGVVRALRARNIPIDATAGVSIGAIIAGAVARGDSTDDLIAEIRASVVEQSPVDVTLPTVSIASGRRVTRNIRDGAQGADVEDTWLNFRCVSANLTQGCLEVHESGPAWAAVRSSFAVPGLFPPMANANGDVLVDGGVLDNLPVTALRAAHAGVRVIAVDVGVQHDPVAMAVPPDGIVSGWRFLASTLRARAFGNLTTLPKLLLRLTELGSLNAADVGDCYVRPKLDGISLLDFGKFDELVSRGERDAGEALDAWLLDESTIDLRDHES